MATIVSVIPPTTVVIGVPTFLFTTPDLVSAYTGGAVQPSEVRSEWITEAMQEVERQSGFSIEIAEFTDVLDGDGSGSVFLHYFPIIEIQSVMIRDHLVPPDHYVITRETGVIRFKNSLFHSWLFPYSPFYYFNAFSLRNQDRGIANIEVKGIRGFSSVPPLIQKICTLLAAKTALMAKAGPMIERFQIGAFSQRYDFLRINDELDRAWKALGKRRPMFSI